MSFSKVASSRKYLPLLGVVVVLFLIVVIAAFAISEERMIHVFPTHVEEDGWMKENLALEQMLSGNAVFEDFNRDNSAFIIFTELGDVDLESGGTDTADEDSSIPSSEETSTPVDAPSVVSEEDLNDTIPEESTESVQEETPTSNDDEASESVQEETSSSNNGEAEEREPVSYRTYERYPTPLPDITPLTFLGSAVRAYVGASVFAQELDQVVDTETIEQTVAEEKSSEESEEVLTPETSSDESDTSDVEVVEDVPTEQEVVQDSEQEVQDAEETDQQEIRNDVEDDSLDVRSCVVLGIPCHTISFSGFDIGSILSDYTVKGYTLRVSLGAKTLGDSFTPDKLLVRYFYKGSWYLAGEIAVDRTVSNFDNGGHFEFQLPNLSSWDALKDFRVEFEYIRQSSARTELFLDSVWIDTVYEVESTDEEIPEVNNILPELAVLEDSGRPDLLVDNEERIKLTATDSVPGDDLVIRSDFDVYNGLTTARAYIAVTNMSDREENFRLITRTGRQANVVRLEERVKNVPNSNDTPTYSEVAYFCEEGWDLQIGALEQFEDEGTLTTESVGTDGEGSTETQTDAENATTDEEGGVETHTDSEEERAVEEEEVPASLEESTTQSEDEETPLQTPALGAEEVDVPEERETEVVAEDEEGETFDTEGEVDGPDTEVPEEESVIAFTTTYTCKATGETETCNSFNADKTNCIVGNDRVSVSETVTYENGWETIDLLEVTDGGESAESFFEYLFGTGSEEEIATILTNIKEADADFRIQPRETRYFAVDLDFEVQRAGEFVVEVEGDEADASRSMWWRSAYAYRMPVALEVGEVEENEAPTLFTVGMDRTQAEFFERSALDGSDVRFYDTTTRQEIPGRVVAYSYVDQTAEYAVELDLSSHATTTFFAYFGNEQVTSLGRVQAPTLRNVPITYAGIVEPKDGAVISVVSPYENNEVQVEDGMPIELVRSVPKTLLLEDGEGKLSAKGPIEIRLSDDELGAGVRTLSLAYAPDMHIEEAVSSELGATVYRLARYVEASTTASFGAHEILPLPAVGVFEPLESKNIFDQVHYIRSLHGPQFHEFREALKDFAIGDDVTFSLTYKAQKGKFSRFWKGLFSERLAQVTEVHLMRDGTVVPDARFEVVYGAEGEWTLHLLEMPRELIPGKYTLSLTIDETGTEYIDSFDFYWGVLVVNTPQSVYGVGDLTAFHMAALDDKGDTICDAELRLVLTNPSGDAEEIRVEPQGTCGANNVTDDPDYLAWYRPQEIGKFSIALTHVNQEGEVVHQITDSFDVTESQSYIIERRGATRIWPKAPYVMELAVTAVADFSGEVVEAVPTDFEILDTGGAETTMWGRAKRLAWSVELEAGETQVLRYEYDAPDVSPYVYVLGPAEIRSGAQTAFIETRTWKLASDALGQYVETFVTITPTVADSWTTIDLSGAPYDIPANAIIEMALINTNYGAELYAGVRHASSTLDRRFLLHEAETTGSGVEGMTEVTVHVTASDTSTIQYYADDTSLVTFRILGYWTNGVYIERFDTTDAIATNDAWTNWDLNTYGLTQGDVAEIVMVNNQANQDYLAGVRTDGSALNRYIRIHEPETGGDSFATMFVEATTSTARIEAYADDYGPGTGTDIDFIVTGYWDTMPTGLEYTEAWGNLGGPTANTTWTDRTLSTFGVQPSAVAEIVFANTVDTNGAIEIGVRPNGSSLGRVLDLHEAEGGSTGVTPSRMMVTAGSDANATIEYYTESTAADNFQLAGYWAAGDLPPDEPTLYDVPFDNEKTGSSTPHFEFSAVDPDGVADIIYQIQWDDDADVATDPLGNHTSDDETGCSPNCFINTVSAGDTSPFTEGNRIRFSIQSALTTGTTYYWRVRAMDTSSAVYGDWSNILSFTYVEDTDPKGWIQTEDTQFDQGTLTGTETYGANKVRLATTPPVGAMVAYGSGVSTSPNYRLWNGTGWSAPAAAQSVGGQVSWTILRAGSTRSEYILGTQDTGGDVNVQIYNGSTGIWGNLLELTQQVGNPAYKGFDIQYLSQSGDAVVAYCDGDQDPSYAVWDGTSWSASATIDLTFTQNCEWLSMATNPVSDELIMVARANVGQTNPDYEAQVFSGVSESWGSAYTGGAGDEAVHEGIAIAYEESGTDAVIAVSNGTGNSFAYNTWDGASWGTAGTVGLGDDFEWGQIASDNGTDDMAICYMDEDNDLGSVFWNGSTNTWGTYREHDTTGDQGVSNTDIHGRPISCMYETTAGRDGYHLVPYSNTINAEYNYYAGGAWQYLLNSGASISSVSDSWTVNTTRTGEGKILAVFHDNANTQYDFSAWDGSSWTTKVTLDANSSRTAEPWYEPIAIAAQQFQESAGSIVSTIVDFDLVPSQPTWGEVIWNTTEPVGTNALLQVYYATTTAACNVPVPDGVLAGNSTGFDATASPLDLSNLSTSTYNMLCIKVNLSSTNAQTPTLNDWSLSWEREPYLTENRYRWYTNSASLTPTDVWPQGTDAVDENTPIPATFAPSFGSILRLRMSLLDTNVSLSASSITLKLQWAEGASCTSELPWADVGDSGSSVPWRGYDNSGVSDGATLPSTLLSTSDTVQSYEESNPTVSNPNSVSTGNEGEWDFVLQHNATSSTNYCFRAIHTDGTVLSAYATYPRLITNAPPTEPYHTAPFDNQALASTTPWFEFVADDVKLDDLHYQIQVDNDIAFGSVAVDMNSFDDFNSFSNLTTPSDKSPFNAGEAVRFIPTTNLTNGTTYWWRVRARDPSGSGEWGEWSNPTSVTVNTATVVTTWYQTTFEQFDTITHEQTEAAVGNSIVLTPPNTTGTATSQTIDFDWGTQGNAWGALAWNDTETAGTIAYKVEYNNAGTWMLVPDSVLAGNSAGFGTSPISLLGLEPATYNDLRMVAVFTDAGTSPSLNDWTLTWGYAVEQPTLISLFDNELVGTTTPSFTFFSTDPETDDLIYEISWSTDATFATGVTTRASDTHAGFTNTISTSDTSPFFDGDTIQFSLQSGDALTNGSTYWWRVRARDPLGTDVWSVYSSQRSFTVNTSVTSSTWHQTTDEQFATDILNSTESSGSDTVRITSVVRDALLVYAEGVLQTPRYRIWNGSTWGTEKSASNIGERMYWARTSASPARDEYTLLTGGVSGAVKAQVYSASTQTWDTPVVMSTPASAVRRGFDVTYETNSGDAIAVACSGTDATYRVWNGTSWSATSAINLGFTQNCEWIELASDPESDEVIMVARANPAQTPNDFEAQVWNGSSWGNSVTQGAMDAGDAENIGMDIEYEESGGDAVFVTSNELNANFYSRTWNGSAWSAATLVTIADDLEIPKLSRDDGTDDLAMCFVAGNGGIYFSRWTGSAWGTATQVSTDSNGKDGSPSFDCVYETTSSRDGYLMFPYTDAVSGYYQYWNTVALQGEISLSTVSDSWAVQSVRTGDGTILTAFWDDANTNIDASEWDGTAWSAKQTLETNVSALVTPNNPVHLSARVYPSVTSGTVVSTPIDFYAGAGPRWDFLSWNDTTLGSSNILYQIEYSTDEGDSWSLVPDGVLSGNSAGFTTGPVSMENMPYTTYNLIRLVASFICSEGTCPTLSDWTVTWSEGVTITGTAQAFDQTTNVTSGTVAVAVNGVLQSGKTGTIAGGAWSILNVTAFPGDTVMVFIDEVPDANEAAAVTVYDGVGNITNVPLYERHLTLGSDDATTTTNALIGLYDYSVSGDEDVFFEVDVGNDLYVCVPGSGACSDNRLLVRSGFTYRPDSANSGTLYTHDIEINGTTTADSNMFYVSGSWYNSGSLMSGGSTVVFTATSTSETVDSTGVTLGSFNTVTFGQTSGSAIWTLNGPFDANGSVSIVYGTLSASASDIFIGTNLSLASGATFLKGTGTTTFDGSVVGLITDATVLKQDLGKVRINGTSKVVRLGAPAKLTSLTIESENTFDVSATNYPLEVLGDFSNRGNFSARSGTVTFTATTTGKVIDPGTSPFYHLTTNGSGGNWSFVPSQLTISGNLTVTAGTLTLSVGTTTVSGNVTNTGGTLVHNNGTLELLGAGVKTLYQNGSPFFNVVVNGAGSWSWTDQNATSSGSMRILNGTLTYPAETYTIGKSLINSGGTINANGGTLRFTSPTSETIRTNGSNLFGLTIDGPLGTFTFFDTNLTASGTVRFLEGTATLPAGTFTVGGSFETTNGAWDNNGGTVRFNSVATGRTVSTNQNTFAHVTFDSALGGWTVQGHATSTGNWSLVQADTFIAESGGSIAVGGTFVNNVPSATTWTGSSLYLYSGTAYTVGDKSQSVELYNALIVGTDTDVRMWQSSAAAYTVDSSGSLYSQDHAEVDGALYIWGDYVRSSGTDYWSAETDFDSADITGTPRPVAVRFANGASAQFTGATLRMVGTAGATTTLQNQGSGSFALSLSDSTLNAQYYRITNTDINGFQILGNSTVESLSDGEYVLSYNTGSMLTVSSTTIDANPALQPERNSFSTSSGVTSGYNVYATGTPTSYWWFKFTSGNFDGELYDNDPGGDPGNIRWDDSGFTIAISGTVYAGEGGGGPSSACDGVSPRVKLVVGGTTEYTTSCDAGNGSFTFAGVAFSGDVSLIAYLDGAFGVRGATVSRTPQSTIADFDIYQSYVIVRHEDTAPLTITQMMPYDTDNDTDIPFDAEVGALTVFPETALFVWSGKEFAPGGDMTLLSGGSGAGYDGTLRLDDNSTLRAVASESYSVGGSWLADTGSTFIPATGTVTFTATISGKQITALSNFYNLTTNGVGGVWGVTAPITVTNDVQVLAGTLGGTTNVTVQGGDFTGNGTVNFTGGTVTIGGAGLLGGNSAWTFNNLTLSTGASAVTTKSGTGNINLSGVLTVGVDQELAAGSVTWTFTGNGTVVDVSGLFSAETSTITFAGTSAMNVPALTYYNLVLAPGGGGSPSYTLLSGNLTASSLTIGNGTHVVTANANTQDPLITILDDVLIQTNAIFNASNINDLIIGGSLTNQQFFISNGGGVVLNSTDTGETVTLGNSSLHHLTVNGVGGGWTIVGNATTTGNFTLTEAVSFTQTSGTTLAVQGIFTNSVGGSATEWSGTTLYLTSGTAYPVNTKTSGADSYGTLHIGVNTDTRMWNSQASNYIVDGSGSLYSQDHAGADGDLYIWGDYTRSVGDEYWSYATDFDGADISGAPRQVEVHLATNATTTLSGGSLTITGAPGATTTISNQGAGTYTLKVTGGTFGAQYYQVRNISTPGLTFSGTPTVNELSDGDFLLESTGGSMITVASSVIDANPVKLFTRNVFATSSGVTSGYNVTAAGVSVSSWRFLLGSGNYYGEAYDSDPGGNPGYIIFSDSEDDVTISGNVYSDEGTTVSGVCNGVNQVVTLIIDGGTPVTTSCLAGTGYYQFTGVSGYAPGDTITVFLDGVAEKAANVTRDIITSIADMHLYENRVIVRHEETNPMSIASLAVYDSGDDADIPFTATVGSPSSLVLPANTKLIVWSGKTFTPNGNVTLTSGGTGTAYDGTLELKANATYISSSTAAESIAVGGSWLTDTNATFSAGLSTVTFTATTGGKTVSPDRSPFYNLTFNGTGGVWTFTDRDATTTSDVRISAGNVTFGTSTLAVGGSFVNSATMSLASTSLRFSSAQAEDVAFGGYAVGAIAFAGTGFHTMTDGNATSTGAVSITAGSVTLPSGVFAVAESFSADGGTFTHAGTLRLYGSLSTQTLRLGTSILRNLNITGTGSWIFADINATTTGTTTIQTGGLTAPSGIFAVGGSFVNNASFNANAGHLYFFATTTGQQIMASSSVLSNVTLNGVGGGWTVLGNATTTGAWRLLQGASFTMASSSKLEVQGVFQNTVGGVATDWTDSELYLNASGTSYTINTKTAGGDSYAFLTLGEETDVRMWDSSGATTTVPSTSSLYSMDHNAVSGDLNIWGEYIQVSGNDYWSYAKNFDGTPLGVGSRQVDVRIAPSSVLSFTGGTLEIIGTASATTTIAIQGGTGSYAISKSGGSIKAEYYALRNMDASGLVLTNAITVQSLSYGDFERGETGGVLLQVSSTTINQNPTKIILGTRFGTTSGVSGVTNVQRNGTTANFWDFQGHIGEIDGEAYDSDGIDACGAIRWDDSICLEVSQTHYRFRADDGGGGAPDSEWYDANWSKRVRVNVTNSNASALINGSVRIDMPYDDDMQSDWTDLRFTDSSGTTSLPYFVETYTTSATATVWVKVPSIPAQGSNHIFAYYGNAVATNGENGLSTFAMFDDFEDDNLSEYSGDTSYFDVVADTGAEGSYVLKAGAGYESNFTVDGIYQTGTSFGQGHTVRFMQYVDASQDDEPCTLFGVQTPGSANENYAVCLDQYPTDKLILAKDVTSNDASGSVLASSTVSWLSGWYTVEIDWLTDNSIYVSVYDASGSLFATTNASDSSYTSGGMGFTFWGQNGAWDFYTARPYTANEPTTWVGLEQSAGGASWKADLDTNYSQAQEEVFRVRFAIENSGPQITDQQWRLQYADRTGYGTCAAVPSVEFDDVPNQVGCGLSPICTVTTSEYADGDTTQQLLTSESYLPFTVGRLVESPSNQTAGMTLNQQYMTEVEYAIELTPYATSDSYCMRTTNGGLELDTYQQVAEVTAKYGPSVTDWSLNSNANISLIEGGTIAVFATGTVSDLNGWEDILYASSSLYRSGLGASCSADDNNCYQLSSLDCPLTDCAGTSCTITCTANMQYFTEPTDAGSAFEGQHWEASVFVVDSTNNEATSTSQGVDVYTMWSLSLVTGDIGYGTLGLAEDTGSVNATTTIENTGNDGIDIDVVGTDMTGGVASTIPASNQKFSTSTFTYSSCVICSALSGAASTIEVDLPKPVSTTPVVEDLYWGLYVPSGTEGVEHYGQNTFYAISD